MSEDALQAGLSVIQASDLSERTKKNYTQGWRKWSGWFGETGVSPLAATGDDALRWLNSRERNRFEVLDVRKAVSFVYQRLGMASPVRDRCVMAAVPGATGVYGTVDEYGETYRWRVRDLQRDYLLWCHSQEMDPFSGGPAQVAEFLRSLHPEFSQYTIETANVAVSRYLEDHGRPGTSHHPTVVAAITECRARRDDSGDAERKQPSERSVSRREVFQNHWRQWCDDKSIDATKAIAADALRYLHSLEHQRTAAARVFQLSQMYQGSEDPFSSEDVLAWKKKHRRALKDGTLPEAPPKRRGRDVIEEMRSANATQPEVVPVGLTREELIAVDADIGDRYAPRTLERYASGYTRFENWISGRGIGIEKANGWYVSVYLKDLAADLRVSTLYGEAASLAMVFDELEFEPNPARDPVVDRYLKRLKRRRRETASQMDAFREFHYQTLASQVENPLPGEQPHRTELRAATDLAMFGAMFDGMLRATEMAAACWGDLKWFDDGSGRLQVPFSKTDQFGEGECTYLSPRTMQSLDRLRRARRKWGRVKPGDDRILCLGREAVGRHVRAACKVAGLQGRFGSHSMRIGMAQELAVAGFGLTMIMNAGRWDSSDMPAYYIRGLKVPESAVAELHRMLAEGRHRVDEEMKGFDVLSSYHKIRRFV